MAVAVEPIGTDFVEEHATRILIVESQRLVGEALAALLEMQSDMHVMGVLDVADISAAARLHPWPQVVLVDFGGETVAASRAAEGLRRAGCDAPMIVVADRVISYQVVLAAIRAEACAIVSGSEPAAKLLRAIRLASAGKSAMPPAVLASVLRDRRVREASLRRVTQREMEVLALLSTGRGSRQIASTLGSGYATVRTHMRSLAGKLAAHSKLEIVARAYELDLIHAPHSLAALGHAALLSDSH